MTYWTNYYRDRPLAATTTASPFAQWLATEELNRATCDLELLVRCRTTHWLVDAGCGDGRDAIYWARTHGLNVLGIDLAESALSRTPDTATNDLGCNGGESRSEGRLTWQHGDLAELSSALVQHHSVAIIYARFSLHALAPVAAASFLQRAYELLCDGGLLLIEARSTQDPLMLSGAPVEDAINDPHGRLYDGGMHYRRFIAFHELLLSLSWLNFTIEYAGEQAAGWASTASEDPVVVRFKARNAPPPTTVVLNYPVVGARSRLRLSLRVEAAAQPEHYDFFLSWDVMLRAGVPTWPNDFGPTARGRDVLFLSINSSGLRLYRQTELLRPRAVAEQREPFYEVDFMYVATCWLSVLATIMNRLDAEFNITDEAQDPLGMRFGFELVISEHSVRPPGASVELDTSTEHWLSGVFVYAVLYAVQKRKLTRRLSSTTPIECRLNRRSPKLFGASPQLYLEYQLRRRAVGGGASVTTRGCLMGSPRRRVYDVSRLWDWADNDLTPELEEDNFFQARWRAWPQQSGALPQQAGALPQQAGALHQTDAMMLSESRSHR